MRVHFCVMPMINIYDDEIAIERCRFDCSRVVFIHCYKMEQCYRSRARAEGPC